MFIRSSHGRAFNNNQSMVIAGNSCSRLCFFCCYRCRESIPWISNEWKKCIFLGLGIGGYPWIRDFGDAFNKLG